jgi:C4-dicarboxylate-specific signal transduction histidine kinase
MVSLSDNYFNNKLVVNGELQLFRTLWYTSNDNLFIVRREGDGEYISEKCNPSISNTFNLEPEQLDGISLKDILDIDMYKSISSKYDECIRKNAPITYEEMHTVDSMQERCWATTVLPVIDEESNVTRILGISREITKIRNAEKALFEYNELLKAEVEERTKELNLLNKELEKKVKEQVEDIRMKDNILHKQAKNAQMGEMISMIAHQWRQPLNAVNASAINISLLQSMNLCKDKDLEEHCEFVQEQTQRMSKIINDFMNFFKPDEKSTTFILEELIEDIKNLMGIQLKNRNILLNCIDGCNEPIVSYKKELEHVLINLISNARDAFEENQKEDAYINISYIVEEGKQIIIVEDNAGGIPEGIIEKIFDPYFTTKGAGKGTGIGLHMTKRIVKEILQGSINVENTKDGARFLIKV